MPAEAGGPLRGHGQQWVHRDAWGHSGDTTLRGPGPICVLVEDEAIAAARDQLRDQYRIPSEHGAAAAFAALTAGAYKPGAGETVAVIVCGANTDLLTLGSSAVGTGELAQPGGK